MTTKNVEEEEEEEEEDTLSPPSQPPIAIAVAIDPQPSAPPLYQSTIPHTDEEEQVVADQARAEGISVISQHCHNHLSNNPESSYVTWIACLHPENAQVSIDPRFLIEGNPWLTVYEEAKEDLQKNQGRVAAADVVSPSQQNGEDKKTDKNEKCSCSSGGFIDYLVGSSLVLAAVTASFVFELAGSYCYLSGWICNKILDKLSPPGMFSCLPFSITYVLAKVFQLLDIVLLWSSILVVESIAGANYVICTILSCSHKRGRGIHQTTRKISHLIRWVTRKELRDGAATSR